MEMVEPAQLLQAHFRAQEDDPRAFLRREKADLLGAVGVLQGVEMADEQLQPHPAALQLDALRQLGEEGRVAHHHAVGFVDNQAHVLADPAAFPAGLVAHLPGDGQDLLLHRLADAAAPVQRVAYRCGRYPGPLGNVAHSQLQGFGRSFQSGILSYFIIHMNGRPSNAFCVKRSTAG